MTLLTLDMHRFRMSCALMACSLTLPRVAGAQTDYYNTDRGRPLHTQDASAVERRAFEIQAAPLRLERLGPGAYRWGIEPELAFGAFPRTHVQVGAPLSIVDAVGVRESGLAGLDVAVFHNLNVETAIPALAIAGSALLPVGNLAADEPYFSLTAIATKTFSWARFHVNGEYTLGDEPSVSVPPIELTRWSAGLAIDRTLPLRSLLFGGEVVAAQPLIETEDVDITAGVGLRYQLAPRWALDAGAGKHLTDDDRGWYFTFGSAYALGLPWRP